MSIPEVPETELLARCLDGDKQAWESFVLKYSRLVRHSLFHTLRHKNPPIESDTIDDLHQDVFSCLVEDNFKKIRQFKGKNGCSLASWIRVIAVRKALDYLRKERATVSTRNDPNALENPIGDPYEKRSSEDEFLRAEEIEIMGDVIRRLHPRHRFFIELYYRQGSPIEEISEIMKLDPNAVYQLQHRVKERIREILRTDYPDIGP